MGMEINVNIRRLMLIIITLMIYFCAMLSVSYALYHVNHDNDDTYEKNGSKPNEIYFVHDIYGERFSERIENLDLSNVTIDENITNYVKLFPNLKTVSFDSQNVDDETITTLLSENPDIEFEYKVEIANKSFTSLTSHLDLTNNKNIDFDTLVEKMKLLSNLKTADFSNCNLSNEQLGHLRELFPNIEINWVVHLGKWSVKTDVVSFSVLVYRFDYTRMTSKEIEVLKYCTKLQALDLGHQAITDVSVIGEYLPNLRILILADNKISDITPLKNLKHLHYLELFINPIKDITPLEGLTELVDVNFCYCW